MPQLDKRIGARPAEEVTRAFANRRHDLERFCETTKDLVEKILKAKNEKIHSIQGRVKTVSKLKRKYLRDDKDYKTLDDITDLVGLRIITYYEDEIDRLSNLVCDEFQNHKEHFTDKRQVEADRFGYSALHHVCSFSEDRSSKPEYEHCTGLQFEIQITTVLGHAWAEMEHEWYDMTDEFSTDIKRRFYRLAALLELADEQFLSIRKERESRERSNAARNQSGAGGA